MANRFEKLIEELGQAAESLEVEDDRLADTLEEIRKTVTQRYEEPDIEAEPEAEPSESKPPEYLRQILTDHGRMEKPVEEPLPEPEPEKIPLKAGIEPDGRIRVQAKDPLHQDGAAVLQTLLDAITGRELGEVAKAMMHVAALVEAVELQNAELRDYIFRMRENGGR